MWEFLTHGGLHFRSQAHHTNAHLNSYLLDTLPTSIHTNLGRVWKARISRIWGKGKEPRWCVESAWSAVHGTRWGYILFGDDAAKHELARFIPTMANASRMACDYAPNRPWLLGARNCRAKRPRLEVGNDAAHRQFGTPRPKVEE